jgi:hypothetical protein
LGAYPSSLQDEYGTVSVSRYNGVQKEKKTFAFRREIPAVEAFKETVSPNSRFALEQSTVLEQILTLKQVEELTPDQRGKAFLLIEKGGPGAVALLSDIYKDGILDNRVLNIGDRPEEAVQEALTIYSQYRETSQAFLHELESHMNPNEMDMLFLERIHQSFVSRGQDLLILVDQGVITSTEFHEVVEAMNGFSDALSNDKNALYTVGKDIEGRQTSLTKTVTYGEGDAKKRASIVVRPENVARHDDKRYDQGQSRIGLLYSISKERKIRMSIDFDEYGLSVDIGSRGDPIVEGLKQLGKSHHTQRHFEKGFQTEQYFAQFAKGIPDAFNWDFQF